MLTHTPSGADALVAGIDEVGRGPLAGAVVAAVVVLSAGQVIPGVRDSKLLSPARRTALAGRIRQEAVAWSLGRAEVAEIDEVNILNATFLAMQRAFAALTRVPGEIRVDGNRAPRFDGFAGRVQCIVGGDRSEPAIAAASILAKVERDAEMDRLDVQFPGYGFASHKGYPTAAHLAALASLGPTPIHRTSFGPVRAVLSRAAS